MGTLKKASERPGESTPTARWLRYLVDLAALRNNKAAMFRSSPAFLGRVWLSQFPQRHLRPSLQL